MFKAFKKLPCTCAYFIEYSPLEMLKTGNYYNLCSMHGSGPKHEKYGKRWIKDNKWYYLYLAKHYTKKLIFK